MSTQAPTAPPPPITKPTTTEPPSTGSAPATVAPTTPTMQLLPTARKCTIVYFTFLHDVFGRLIASRIAAHFTLFIVYVKC